VAPIVPVVEVLGGQFVQLAELVTFAYVFIGHGVHDEDTVLAE